LETDHSYAPFGAIVDAHRLGLIETRVPTPLGLVSVHHSPHRIAHSSASALLLIHGAAGSWTTWTPMMLAARHLGRRFSNVVAVDLPGWGSSRLAVEESAVSVDAVADVLKRVLVALGYGQCRIVGHSMGGLIGLHLAATAPALVESVALVSGTSWSIIRSTSDPEHSEVPEFTNLLRVMKILTRFGTSVRALITVLTPFGVMRMVSAPLFRHVRKVPASVIRTVASDLRPASFVLAAELAKGYRASELWSAIRCTVRAVAGDRDVFVTPKDLRDLAGTIPGAQLTTISDCGHFPHVEHPFQTLAALGL
jgi:pimeloyl-ACP methyl ester carboxylesterase